MMPFSIRCGTVSYPVAYLRVFDQYCVSILTCIITFWSALYTIPYHFVFKAYPSRIGDIYYEVCLVRRYRYGILYVSEVYPVSIPIRIFQDVIWHVCIPRTYPIRPRYEYLEYQKASWTEILYLLKYTLGIHTEYS